MFVTTIVGNLTAPFRPGRAKDEAQRRVEAEAALAVLHGRCKELEQQLAAVRA